MRIVIVGGGVVGSSLAEHLLKEKHQLSVIELNADLCESIAQKLDVQIIQGSGSSPEMLRRAGIDEADMVLAVTPIDEVNMVVCALASQYEVKRRIARLRSPEFISAQSIVDLGRLGITSVIHPEQVIVDQVMQYVETPHAIDAANFEEGRILLRGYRLRDNMKLAGKTPMEVRQEISPSVVLFAAISRGGKGMIPTGNTRFEPGDIVYTLFPRESLDVFLDLVGIERKKNRKILVSGDSFAFEQMGWALSRAEHHSTLITPNYSLAETIAGRYDKISVIHGDCTNADLLRELNVNSASFFISVSDSSDYNILSTLLAKAEGAHEVVATSTETRHDRLFNSIGIDHVINPRLTAARAILDIIARGHIGAVVELSNIDIEAARYIVEPESEIAGQKVKRIARQFKAGAIIGIIVRDERIVLPDGETEIQTGDHIIVITHHRHLPTFAKLFKPRGLFG
ncbi:MAG: Trk system potassium transporter TrkA [candidate division Zixibacteria bacterium]|nr:Trk system potassium transporter TrkA [candidate division Zixibacteria bacterium]